MPRISDVYGKGIDITDQFESAEFDDPVCFLWIHPFLPSYHGRDLAMSLARFREGSPRPFQVETTTDRWRAL
jgi:hypothetical protein